MPAAAALHLALLYLWQLDLLRLEGLERLAAAAGLWLLDSQLPSSQLVPQVRAAPRRGRRWVLKAKTFRPPSSCPRCAPRREYAAVRALGLSRTL